VVLTAMKLWGNSFSHIDIRSSSRMPTLYATNYNSLACTHPQLLTHIISRLLAIFLQIPMCACIWPSPSHEILGFPALFVLSFFRDNQLLEVNIHLIQFRYMFICSPL
jgi:hypothetical protein